ncbi:MAG: hypothetical protein ACLVG5_07965 [Clostridium sp.]
MANHTGTGAELGEDIFDHSRGMIPTKKNEEFLGTKTIMAQEEQIEALCAQTANRL